ncbi:MAG: hypothetical protein ACYCZF_16165 [Anaerolineae bacterium]
MTAVFECLDRLGCARSVISLIWAQRVEQNIKVASIAAAPLPMRALRGRHAGTIALGCNSPGMPGDYQASKENGKGAAAWPLC